MLDSMNIVLDRFTNGIQEILGERLKQIILYGSYARGDYNKSSDIDIMILTNLTDEEISSARDEISDLAFDLEMEYNVIISPVIKNIDKFNYWLEVQPFYQNVKNEGVVLSG